MSSSPDEHHHSLLPGSSSDVPDTAHLSPPDPSSHSPLHARHTFRRTPSSGEADIQYHVAPANETEDDLNATEDPAKPGRYGLGITTYLGKRSLRSSIPRRPVGATTGSEAPSSTEPLRSPPLSVPKFQYAYTPSGRSAESLREVPIDGRSSASSHYPYMDSSDTEPLNQQHTPSSATLTTTPRQGPGYEFDCPTHQEIEQSRWSWLSVSILILAVYSTAMSGMYLIVAMVKPHFGNRISVHGGLTPSTASLLSALFAKTIELSFVTVFVAFLGQVLTRRAILNKSRPGGITIAEMSMRTWIMQPGTLITHWEAVKYAALTFLGVIALTAAFIAMLYTTAADALVSPKLKFGGNVKTVLYGKVAAEFANSVYLKNHCPTPIQLNVDPDYAGTTCLQIEHAGQAYHNYEQYLSLWAEQIGSGNDSSIDLRERPPPTGIMFDNTTVLGQWIEIKNMTEDSMKWGRMMNNVTMAMPHANIFNAARDSLNGIMQPEDITGNGEYYINASVPSPAVNIMCVGMTAEELSPLIWSNWSSANVLNVTTWETDPPANIPAFPDWLNRTVVDKIFDWGKDIGAGQRPPIFPRLPAPYNTLVNNTNRWPGNAVYILAGSPSAGFNPPYVLCSLKAMQTPNCSTQYHAAVSGGDLNAHCEDPWDPLAYYKSEPLATSGKWETDWHDVASIWQNALSLGTGISDGDAANSRLLTQMIPAFDPSTNTSQLNPSLPSIAEAVAVMSGCTLVLSTQDAPFIHFWNYSTTVSELETPQYQGFNATVRTQDYASGGVRRWQGIFYVVLVLVFATNVFSLIYLAWSTRGEGQVTDYTEPQNLFALAVNSPPSETLSGACAAGPEGDQFKKSWYVGMAEPKVRGEGPHFYVKCKEDDDPDAKSLTRRSARKMTSFEIDESPAVEQYKKLANRRKSLL